LAHVVRRHGEIVKQRAEGGSVEYLALVYGNPEAWDRLSEEERSAAYEGYMAVSRDAAAAGALVDASELEATPTATSVRVRNGEAIVTDGPYAEVKESLGGYYLFSCDTIEDAIAWAAKIPAAWHGGAVEVRPVHVDEEAAA
jgi:hypothetical protein